MIGVDGNAGALAEQIAKIQRLRERVHAGAVRGIHRVQRLDRERHPAGAGVRQDRGNALRHHLSRGNDIARAFRQAADHHDQAFGAKRRSLVDGALVVIDCRCCPALSAAGNMPPRQ